MRGSCTATAVSSPRSVLATPAVSDRVAVVNAALRTFTVTVRAARPEPTSRRCADSVIRAIATASTGSVLPWPGRASRSREVSSGGTSTVRGKHSSSASPSSVSDSPPVAIVAATHDHGLTVPTLGDDDPGSSALVGLEVGMRVPEIAGSPETFSTARARR